MADPVNPEAVLAAVGTLKTDLEAKVEGLKKDLSAEVATKIEEVKGMIPAATASAMQPLQRAVFGDKPTQFKHLSNQDLNHLGAQMNFILKARKNTPAAESKAMGLTVGEDGGFAVPSEFKSEILRKLYKQSAMRQLAMSFPGVGKKGTINKEAGTVELTYEGEVTPSDETVDGTGLLGQVAWDLKKLRGVTYISNDLMRFQQIDMLNYLADRYATAIMQNEDKVFMNGDGSKQPLGLRRYRTGANTVARNSGARALWQDMRRLKHRVPVQYRNEGAWFLHNDLIELLANSVDDNKRPLWIELGSNAASALGANVPAQTVGFFDGRPVFENNNIPVTMSGGNDTGGTLSEIIFSALRYAYAIFEDGAWEMSVSDQVRFKEDQLAMKVVLFHDGKPTQTEATGFLTGVETPAA